MPTAGEPHAWVMEAVEAYEAPLSRYARRLLADVDLAADAVQHAFVTLCSESRERLEGRVAPWLFRVCRNRALDHLRRAGRERTLGDGGATEAAADAAAPVTLAADDPAARVERADLAALVRDLLADLPAPQRETIDLWCEGLSYRQIAEVTGRQEGHVRVLAHRGLTALRRHPRVTAVLAAERPRGDALPSSAT
jgi:RNA polymerase sigma factor (sigma-70 family)